MTLAGASSIGGLLAATLDGPNAFYICDANGNITDLLAEDGALLAHYAYAPWQNGLCFALIALYGFAIRTRRASVNPFAICPAPRHPGRS